MSSASASTIIEDRFLQFLAVSVGFHIALVLAFTIKTYWFPSKDLIIQSAIRVDMVALPEKPKEKPAPAKSQPAPEKPTKPKTKPKVPQKVEKKPSPKFSQKKAIEQLKAQAAIDEIAASLKEKSPDPKPSKPEEFKGNMISSGDSFSGLARVQFDDYYSQIKSHLRQHWDLPQWLADADLKAQATVSLDERGYVTAKQIISSSGNSVFDEIVLKAIEASSPFPAPPSRLSGALKQGALVLNFPE